MPHKLSFAFGRFHVDINSDSLIQFHPDLEFRFAFWTLILNNNVQIVIDMYELG